MNEIELLTQKIQHLENIIANIAYSDRFIFQKNIQLLDARNIQIGISTGTKIGTATGQKLAFYNSTPVIQQSSIGATGGITGGSGTTVKEDHTFTGGTGSIAYRVNDVVKHLKTVGLIAS